ncbi:MAG: hypothetical protein ACRDD2_04425 [Sarcina sp.]
MIKIKLEINKRGEINFRANVEGELKENTILKRALFEANKVKSKKEYPYLIPMRFLLPIINNIEKEKIELSKESIEEFLEFSDYYEEKTYYAGKATATYMKKWREEDCPKIFKVTINKETLEINKFVAFELVKN